MRFRAVASVIYREFSPAGAEGFWGDGHGADREGSSALVRVTHWVNAIAIIIMIGSGWHIYNNSR